MSSGAQRPFWSTPAESRRVGSDGALGANGSNPKRVSRYMGIAIEVQRKAQP